MRADHPVEGILYSGEFATVISIGEIHTEGPKRNPKRETWTQRLKTTHGSIVEQRITLYHPTGELTVHETNGQRTAYYAVNPPGAAHGMHRYPLAVLEHLKKLKTFLPAPSPAVPVASEPAPPLPLPAQVPIGGLVGNDTIVARTREQILTNPRRRISVETRQQPNGERFDMQIVEYLSPDNKVLERNAQVGTPKYRSQQLGWYE